MLLPIELQTRSFAIRDGGSNIAACGAPDIEGFFSKGPVSVSFTNVFQRGYKLFWMSYPGETPADFETLRALSLRHSIITYILLIVLLLDVILTILITNIILFFVRLLDLFKPIFPYCNTVDRLIMDTEKVHALKHCHVDVAKFANLIKFCCDRPEGGHKTWVHQQGLRTHQGNTSAVV